MHILPQGSYNLWIQTQQDTMLPIPVDYRLRFDAYHVCGEDGVINAPGDYSSNTCGEGDDCQLDFNQQYDTEDRLVRVNIPHPGLYTFSLCGSTEPWDSYLTLMNDCCNPNGIVAQDNDGCGASGLSRITCLALDPGNFYALVESNPNENGGCTDNFTLTVTECSCPAADSLVIQSYPGMSGNVRLKWISPYTSFARIYASTSTTSVFPAGFTAR
jgi:hypothetical protein